MQARFNKPLELSPLTLLLQRQLQQATNCECVASGGGAAQLYVRLTQVEETTARTNFNASFYGWVRPCPCTWHRTKARCRGPNRRKMGSGERI